ncbi:MAG: serine/threonine protein kinase [Planctomycetes bacterium]|nr:serine/threonine protein kinase [Planctomycetota bacterium]
MDIRQNDLLFGKIALNKRLITRDLLNRALHYQRTQAPDRQLGEILLEKGVLTKEQVDEILAFQERVNKIKSTQNASIPAVTSSFFNASTQLAGPTSAPAWGPPTGMSAAQAAPIYGGPVGGGTAVAMGPTPSPDQDPLIGEVIGGCTINAKIGAGGMGAIYLAHHEALRKDVVVKILPPESAANPRTVERFFREARAAAKLEHPNIVQVQDVGTTERNLHYIIMQYIDGSNLEEKIQAAGRHTPQEATRIVLEIARGLQTAHRAGVIHRDIKAENILITQTGQVKLTDFGLAKDLNSELKLTADGAMIGTPLYMAPEIGRVKEIDGRVDVYSLGVTYYYLLTGVQPFRGFSALEILSAKAHDKLRPPEEVVPDMPDEFRRVLGKMLEKDRDQRYRDMDALIRELEALDRGFPIEAGEPSIWPPRGAAKLDNSASQRRRAGKKTPTSGPRAAAPAAGDGMSAGTILVLLGGVGFVLVLLVVVVLLIAFG